MVGRSHGARRWRRRLRRRRGGGARAALPRSFFEDWGWLAGPGAWGVCALVAGAWLRLPLAPVLAGAALSGLLMLPGVFVGAHWIGAPLGLAAFGAWCGRLAARRPGVPVAA